MSISTTNIMINTDSTYLQTLVVLKDLGNALVSFEVSRIMTTTYSTVSAVSKKRYKAESNNLYCMKNFIFTFCLSSMVFVSFSEH